MLIEAVAFNLREVGEKSIMDIKNECLCSFAYDLKRYIAEMVKEAQKDGNNYGWGTWMYKAFQDTYGSKISYNSKNIVYEETIYNDPKAAWSVKRACEDAYGLRWVKETEESSGYYIKDKSAPRLISQNCCCEEAVGTESVQEDYEKLLTRFHEFFGLGEFPFMTITLLRLGNVDHFFYKIHR